MLLQLPDLESFSLDPWRQGALGQMRVSLSPPSGHSPSLLLQAEGQAVKIKASNTFQRKFFAPNTLLARVVLHRGASWRPSPWQGLQRDFQNRGMSGNIQCLRKAHFVPWVFDGTSLSDNRPPEPA